LREGGFTSFHRRVVLLTGFAWTFVAFEIILIGFVLPTIFSQFGLTPASNPVLYFLVASATLIGSFIGSLLLGRLADDRGRRTVFLTSILWYSVFTGLTAVAWDPWSVFGFRLLAGLGLGGMLVVDPSLLSEFLPPQSRGRYMVLLDFFWPIGFLLAIAFWWIFIIQGGGQWRWLLARATVPESPFYFARQGRLDDAAKVLRRVTGLNVATESLSKEQMIPRAPISALFGGRLLRRSAVTIVVWIALNFSYYGLFLSLPFALPVFAAVGLDVGLLAEFFIVSALAQFPGYLVSMFLVEAWGRKRTLAVFLILGGVSGYFFATATELGCVGGRVSVHERAFPHAVPGDGIRDGGRSGKDHRHLGTRVVRRFVRLDGWHHRSPDRDRGGHGPRWIRPRGDRARDEGTGLHLMRRRMESL